MSATTPAVVPWPDLQQEEALFEHVEDEAAVTAALRAQHPFFSAVVLLAGTVVAVSAFSLLHALTTEHNDLPVRTE